MCVYCGLRCLTVWQDPKFECVARDSHLTAASRLFYKYIINTYSDRYEISARDFAENVVFIRAAQKTRERRWEKALAACGRSLENAPVNPPDGHRDFSVLGPK